MKEDEAKRLTPRQIVYIKATFNEVTPSGNVDCNVMLKDGEIAHVLTAPNFVLDNDLQQEGKPTHNEEAEENKPKYDPCRLFRKGDKVRVVKCNGRHYNLWTKKVENQIFVVDEDEGERACVSLGIGGNRSYSVDAPYLQLVTPVEELEPYKVWDTTFSFNVGVEDSKAVFYYGADMSTCPYTKGQAKAAAEAERKRLNEEYRKKQNNG